MTAIITTRPATQRRESWTGKLQRSFTTEYVLEEGTDSKGQQTEVVVTLTTSHWPDSKSYASSITRWRRTYEGVFTSDLCSLLQDSLTIAHIRSTDRYSVKTLQAHHASAEAVLMDLVELDPKVGVIFDASLAPQAA